MDSNLVLNLDPIRIWLRTENVPISEVLGTHAKNENADIPRSASNPGNAGKYLQHSEDQPKIRLQFDS